MRFRYVYLVFVNALILAGLVAVDPNASLIPKLPFGAPLLIWLLESAKFVFIAALAHCTWKAWHDYPAADGESLYRQVHQGNLAAGVALLARAITMAAMLMLFATASKAQVPERAHEHLPGLKVELDRHWPLIPIRHYLPGLIEHESCISLTHSRCWSPTSRLKSAREEGAGLGQITRAWRADGSLRFDALEEMRQAHPALADLSWGNVYSRPDLQMRAVVLKVRGDFERLSDVRDVMQRLAMADAAYNGGLNGLHSERRACGLTLGCDPQRWWGNVERTCMKSRAALYAGRSACDINRHHVHDVLRVRAPKYIGLI